MDEEKQMIEAKPRIGERESVKRLVANIVLATKSCGLLLKRSLEDNPYIIRAICSLESDDKKIAALEQIEDANKKTVVIQSLTSDERKLECLESIEYEELRTCIIQSLSTDEAKIKAISLVEGIYEKIKIINSLKDDDKKVEFLDEIDSDSDKAIIVLTLSSDEKKLECIESFSVESSKAEVIASLSSDDKKIEYLESLEEGTSKAEVIASLSSDEKKLQLLSLLEKESDISKVIVSLEDQEKKIEFIDKLASDDEKTKVILSLPTENMMDYIGKIDDDKNVMRIANTLVTFELEYEEIKRLAKESENPGIKAVMISQLPEKEQKKILKKTNSFELYELVRTQRDGYILLSDIPIEEYLKMGNYPENKIEFMAERYKEILKINENVTQSINLEILSPEFADVFNKEQIARITAQKEIQDKIVAECNTPLKQKVLKEICKDDNDAWLLQINNILDNFSNYEGLFEELENDKNIDKINVAELLEVLSDSDNYFGVHSVEDVNNFENIRKETCLKLLDGENPENVSDKILQMDPLSKKKFALLQLYFGVDLDEAENLTKKYGEDIFELWKADKENVSLETILLMKTIYEAERIEDLDVFKNQVQTEDFKMISSKSISQIENECIKYFSQKFNDSLFRVDGKSAGEEIELDPKKPFNMMIRVEGAYGSFEEPKNFREYFDKPDITYHGCCKSFIGNNMLAMANTDGAGPIFGYNDLEYLIMAPWDIYSDSANVSLSIASSKHNEGLGIQYRTPKEMIDRTRRTHNEIVSDRLVYNKDTNKLEKEKPQYVIWLKEKSNETKEERSKNARWKMTKKAAEQLGIPIVIIDKEAILENETKKIEDYKQIFAGEKENTENLTDKQLLEKMIVEFENNRIGNYFSCKDENAENGNNYFLAQDREELFSFIESELEQMREKNPERYKECLDALIEIVSEEPQKGTSEEKNFRQIYMEKLAHLVELKERIVPNYKAKTSESKTNQEQPSVSLTDSLLVDACKITIERRRGELENAAKEIMEVKEERAENRESNIGEI